MAEFNHDRVWLYTYNWLLTLPYSDYVEQQLRAYEMEALRWELKHAA